MSSAARQRRRRERIAAGRLVMRLEVDEALADALVAAGFLRAEVADERAAIEAALERVVELWSVSVTRDNAGILTCALTGSDPEPALPPG